MTTQTEKSAVELNPSNVYAKKSLLNFLGDKDYTRVLLWPQNQINKVLTWSANQESVKDWENYKPNPYHSLPMINGSTKLANKVFGAIFHFLGHTLVKTRRIVINMFGKTPAKIADINNWSPKCSFI